MTSLSNRSWVRLVVLKSYKRISYLQDMTKKLYAVHFILKVSKVESLSSNVGQCLSNQMCQIRAVAALFYRNLAFLGEDNLSRLHITIHWYISENRLRCQKKCSRKTQPWAAKEQWTNKWSNWWISGLRIHLHNCTNNRGGNSPISVFLLKNLLSI